MRKYLATLHKRSPHHKKRFALLTSGAFTLSLFAVWALVNFGEGEATPAAAEKSLEVVSPFDSLKNEAQAGFSSLRKSFDGLKNDSLNIYGQ